MKKILFLIIVLVSILTSCDDNKSEFYPIIQSNQEGHLRGVSIGMLIDSVKTKENSKYLKSSQQDYLHYDYSINMGNSYTVAYDFTEESKLYEIELTVFFDAIEDAQTLFLDFEKQFNQKYGEGNKEEDGFTVWNSRSETANIEVAMINDSQEYGYLSIIIRDLDY